MRAKLKGYIKKHRGLELSKCLEVINNQAYTLVLLFPIHNIGVGFAPLNVVTLGNLVPSLLVDFIFVSRFGFINLNLHIAVIDLLDTY